MNTCIYWLRNDLRLHDNECLSKAISEYDQVIPVYIIDPYHYRFLDDYGFKKIGIQRYRFLCDTLIELKKSFQKIGGNLMIRKGNTQKILKKIALEYSACTIITQQEVAPEEINDDKEVQKVALELGIDFISIWGRSLYHLHDIPYEPNSIPLTSKAFRINITQATVPRDEIDTPMSMNTPPFLIENELPSEREMDYSAQEIDTKVQNMHIAGETAALNRVKYYFYDSQLLSTYKWSRNKSLGMDYSSKLSPYLALGSLSPRTVYHEVKKYEISVKKNISTWWMIFELIWRDFFIFKSMRVGEKLFHIYGYKNKNSEPWNYNKRLFERWKSGQTGIPFLDAHQKELVQIGFMSNRGRVNSASFFTQDYRLDWRWGAAWFEHCLLDYDVYSNWMNWHLQAFEMYYTNPLHQAMKYDKSGNYTLSQIPKLAALPHHYYHAPWLFTDEELSSFGIRNYKRPEKIYSKWNRAINNIIQGKIIK